MFHALSHSCSKWELILQGALPLRTGLVTYTECQPLSLWHWLRGHFSPSLSLHLWETVKESVCPLRSGLRDRVSVNVVLQRKKKNRPGKYADCWHRLLCIYWSASVFVWSENMPSGWWAAQQTAVPQWCLVKVLYAVDTIRGGSRDHFNMFARSEHCWSIGQQFNQFWLHMLIDIKAKRNIPFKC